MYLGEVQPVLVYGSLPSIKGLECRHLRTFLFRSILKHIIIDTRYHLLFSTTQI